MQARDSNAYRDTRISLRAYRLLDPPSLARTQDQSLDQLAAAWELGRVLAESLPSERKNRAVEQALITRLLAEVLVLQRPLAGAARALIIYWSRKFELFNLKALIRGKINGQRAGEIQENLYELPAFIRLPHDQLLRTESIFELLRRLEQGPYGDIALQARRSFEEKQQPFLLDATIDQRFFVGLAKHVQSCEPPDRTAAGNLVAALIDQQNLLWLLRYRFSYGLTPSETYYLLCPLGGRLRRDLLLKLVNLSSLEKVMEALPPLFRSHLAGVSTQMEAERGLDAQTMEEARRKILPGPSVAARALAYLILRENDFRRIFALVQGKVLGLPDQLIRYAVGSDGGPEGRAPVAP